MSSHAMIVKGTNLDLGSLF